RAADVSTRAAAIARNGTASLSGLEALGVNSQLPTAAGARPTPNTESRAIRRRHPKPKVQPPRSTPRGLRCGVASLSNNLSEFLSNPFSLRELTFMAFTLTVNGQTKTV